MVRSMGAILYSVSQRQTRDVYWQAYDPSESNNRVLVCHVFVKHFSLDIFGMFNSSNVH